MGNSYIGIIISAVGVLFAAYSLYRSSLAIKYAEKGKRAIIKKMILSLTISENKSFTKEEMYNELSKRGIEISNTEFLSICDEINEDVKKLPVL